MVTRQHRPRLETPHYGGPADGTVLHRYLDDQFVPQFLQDAAAGRLTGAAGHDWRARDRFGRHQDLPHLRLPLHRTFYIACCEVVCDNPGYPAFDPARIVSAGLVLRRRGRGGAERWLLRGGQPTGWVAGAIPDYEPSEYRRLRVRGLVKPTVPEPPYCGEETSPLHPVVVRAPDGRGGVRSHTLLYGYLPLGGSYRVSSANPAPPVADEALDLRLLHAWPFGSDGANGWSPFDGVQVRQGRPTTAFAELLATLVQTHRVQSPATPENAPLRTLLDRILFYGEEPAAHPLTGVFTVPAHARRGSLLDFLDAAADPLLGWLADYQRGSFAASGDLVGSLLPGAAGLWLYVTEEQAAHLRDLLAIRTEKAARAQVDDLALPRYGQGDDDVYFAVPFVRHLDERGCEQIVWGPASLPFRVASPLDPEAARPQAIQLPGFDEIRRGVAKGVTFLAPKSLADKIRELKLDMDMTRKDPGRLSTCWSFSFSIPAITLCAMLLLMVVLNLLNLIFFWLPWVFLSLPRLCFKAEGKADGGSS